MVKEPKTLAGQLSTGDFDRGRNGSSPPLPPNRTGGSPASGSPVSGSPRRGLEQSFVGFYKAEKSMNPKESVGPAKTPPLRLTATHAAARVEGLWILSIRLNHTPPFTPLTRASSMRSVHTWRSTQSQSLGLASPACIAPSGTTAGCVSSCVVFTHPPSCIPLLHRHYPASTLLWML